MSAPKSIGFRKKILESISESKSTITEKGQSISNELENNSSPQTSEKSNFQGSSIEKSPSPIRNIARQHRNTSIDQIHKKLLSVPKPFKRSATVGKISAGVQRSPAFKKPNPNSFNNIETESIVKENLSDSIIKNETSLNDSEYARRRDKNIAKHKAAKENRARKALRTISFILGGILLYK